MPVSSEDCGNPGKTTDLGAGVCTTKHAGTLLTDIYLGFCLVTQDRLTWDQGLPPTWGLEITWKP